MIINYGNTSQNLTSLLPLLPLEANENAPAARNPAVSEIQVSVPRPPSILNHVKRNLSDLCKSLKDKKEAVSVQVEFSDRQEGLILFVQDPDCGGVKTTLQWTLTQTKKEDIVSVYTHKESYYPYCSPLRLQHIKAGDLHAATAFQTECAREILTYIQLVSTALKVGNSEVLDELASSRPDIQAENTTTVATFGARKFTMHFTRSAPTTKKSDHIAQTHLSENSNESFLPLSEVTKLADLIGIEVTSGAAVPNTFKTNRVKNWLIHHASFPEFVAIFDKSSWSSDNCISFFEHHTTMLLTELDNKLKTVEKDSQSAKKSPLPKHQKKYPSLTLNVTTHAKKPSQLAQERDLRNLEAAQRKLEDAVLSLYTTREELEALNGRLICLIAINLKQKLVKEGLQKTDFESLDKSSSNGYLEKFIGLLSDKPEDHEKFYNSITATAGRNVKGFIDLFSLLITRTNLEPKGKETNRPLLRMTALLRKNHNLLTSYNNRINNWEQTHNGLLSPHKHPLEKEEKKEDDKK